MKQFAKNRQLQIDKPIKVFTTKEAGENFISIITGKSALSEPKDLFINITRCTPDEMPPRPLTKFLLPFAIAVWSCLFILFPLWRYKSRSILPKSITTLDDTISITTT